MPYEEIQKHNPHWPLIGNYLYRILIAGSSRSRKTKVLRNLIHRQPDIYKIYLYITDPYKVKYHYLTDIREGVV